MLLPAHHKSLMGGLTPMSYVLAHKTGLEWASPGSWISAWHHHPSSSIHPGLETTPANSTTKALAKTPVASTFKTPVDDSLVAAQGGGKEEKLWPPKFKIVSLPVAKNSNDTLLDTMLCFAQVELRIGAESALHGRKAKTPILIGLCCA